MAGLDRPTEGSLQLNGSDYRSLNLDRCRRQEIAMIFQAFQLFPLLTVLENVCFPMEANGVKQKEAKAKAKELLTSVGISEEQHQRYPANLSGGEQQRVAIARALSSGAGIILADEPVASLDPITAKQVMEDFVRINKEYNISILLNIHHVDLALKYCDRVIGVRAGEIVFDGPASTITQEQIDAVYNGTKVPTMGDGE